METSIIMEYCDQGTLLEKHKQIWELFTVDMAAALRWILRTLIDVAAALEHMHSMGLIHGDLKCNNILLQSTRSEARGFRCKVADMGCSRLLTAAREAIMTGTYGAPSYAAPEVLKEGSLTQVIFLLVSCISLAEIGVAKEVTSLLVCRPVIYTPLPSSAGTLCAWETTFLP